MSTPVDDFPFLVMLVIKHNLYIKISVIQYIVHTIISYIRLIRQKFMLKTFNQKLKNKTTKKNKIDINY